MSYPSLLPHTNRLDVFFTATGSGSALSEMATDAAITGATNASPIVITSAGHGLSTGDEICIRGVGGNTAANGTWTITKIDSDSFSLDGSTGNGAYTSGGAWAYRRWRVSPSSTSNYLVDSLVVYIEDNAAFRADYYGATTALANGINLYVKDPSILASLTPSPITKIGHWFLFDGDNFNGLSPTTGNHCVAIRIPLFGCPLRGGLGEFLELDLLDPIGQNGAAGLVSHLVRARGVQRTGELSLGGYTGY